jgi:hypothetical protein
MRDVRLELARAVRFTDGAPDVSGLPCDQIDDAEGETYMQRYHLLFTRDRSIRFHRILASDPVTDALHDHPWDFVTVLLSGGYTEITPDGPTHYDAPCVLVRSAEQPHRLVLDAPAWTYIVCGAVRRTWGYRTDDGLWVPWRRKALGDFTPCGTGPNGRPW